MKLGAFSIVSLLWLIIAAQAKTIPKEVWGKCVVSRVLPTTTIACWGDSEAKTLVGTEIEYSPDLFRWNNVITRRPTALIQVVSAERFRDDNSGQGTNRITFQQLGLNAKEVTQISIQHPPAAITGATVEIPGDNILLKDTNTIILSVCNVYFEARRGSAK